MTIIRARVGLQQRVLPEYRVPFFDSLATTCLQGLSVFAGQPRKSEAIETGKRLAIARHSRALNFHLSHGRTYACWQLGLIPWLEDWDPDVLIVEANPRYLSTPAAINWMHTRRQPVIGWGLGAPATFGIEKLLRIQFLHRLDALIAYSNTGAQQYVDAGVKPDRVFVAANAVTGKPKDPPILKGTTPARDRPSLLYIGRLQARKRIEVLLRACAFLPVDLQPYLTIIGEGPDRSNLESLAWKVYPRALFTGAKHGKDLELYFSEADLFILPGTGGLSVQQAMAHALPVIVGQADGTQNELVRSENGWILQDDQPSTLAALLKDALKDIPHLRRMGLASYKIVSEEVNIENMVETFAKAIKSVR